MIMMKWCLSCCEPELPDIDVKFTCRSTCCVSNTADAETNTEPNAESDPSTSTQAKVKQKTKKKKKKFKHGRQRENVE